MRVLRVLFFVRRWMFLTIYWLLILFEIDAQFMFYTEGLKVLVLRELNKFTRISV